MKKKKKKSRLDNRYPCLESLLIVMNGDKGARMFRKRVKVCKDGSKDPFTNKGYREYKRLLYVLRGAANLTEIGADVVSRMIDRLDEIADEM